MHRTGVFEAFIQTHNQNHIPTGAGFFDHAEDFQVKPLNFRPRKDGQTIRLHIRLDFVHGYIPAWIHPETKRIKKQQN